MCVEMRVLRPRSGILWLIGLWGNVRVRDAKKLGEDKADLVLRERLFSRVVDNRREGFSRRQG